MMDCRVKPGNDADIIRVPDDILFASHSDARASAKAIEPRRVVDKNALRLVRR
jgi:hypothetical protein